MGSLYMLMRYAYVAGAVQALRRIGYTYEVACEAVGEACGLSSRTVQRDCAEYLRIMGRFEFPTDFDVDGVGFLMSN